MTPESLLLSLPRRRLSGVLVSVLAFCATGCASNYAKNRGRDACDMVTATVGVGIGARVQLGPLPMGPICVSDTAGLRSGQFFRQSPDLDNPSEFDNRVPLVAARISSLALLPCAFFGYNPMEGIARIWDFAGENWSSYDRQHFDEVQRLRHKEEQGPSSASFWRIEACAGLGATVRLGLNPAEILDFALGLFGLDPLDDDIARLNPDGG